MKLFQDLIHDRSEIVNMHRSDLAGYVLEALMSIDRNAGPYWLRSSFCTAIEEDFRAQFGPRGKDIGIACSTAWSWLETNGLICRRPDEREDWFDPTPFGQSIRDHRGVRAMISNEQLPEAFLHPELLINVRPLYLQSRFETAVFEAFKSLEVAIRASAGLGHDLVGVALAARAFSVEDGALTDKSVERGERVALMNLMSGAIGSYKNPSSHRRVAISATEARDMIILASHLLKIVDARAKP